MNKEELIEIVRLRVKPVVDETDYTNEAWIEKVMTLVYAEMVSAYDFDLENSRYFTKDYEVAVLQDSVTDFYYSAFPAKIIYVQDAAGAVRFISPKKQKGLVFVPIMDTDLELIQELNTNIVDTKIKYTVGRDKIRYDGITSDLITSGVLIRLVVAFDAYEYTDEIYIPSDQQKTFIDQIILFIGGDRDVDLVNDNR